MKFDDWDNEAERCKGLTAWKRVWGLGDGVRKTGMVLHRKQGDKEEGRLLGNFPGQKREILREEALSEVLLCAVGGYICPEQTDPRGWSHLVGSWLFIPSCFL